MKIWVTGAAGFIGYHVAQRLLERGEDVLGLDSLNDYYDVSLKEARIARLREHSQFRFKCLNLADKDPMVQLFKEERPEKVAHLAAQAGVRYSIENPYAYIESNILAFINVLEGCRHTEVKHLTFASSSSVYGANTKMPFSVHDNVDHPVSLYAASKKSNELMAHSYSHLYEMPVTGLRFFSVYGPWGRPDMALFLFTKAILNGDPIDVYNYGKMKRDFTYIDDIVEGIVRVLDHPAEPNPNWSGERPDPGTSYARYRLYNIGNHHQVELEHLINVLEDALGKKAIRRLLPLQPGDVPESFADVENLKADVGFEPNTSIEVGVQRFVEWYLAYYKP